MLHRVLYPQVHDNGIKKKKKKERELSDVAAGVWTKAEAEAKYNFIRLFQQLPQREKVAKGRVESKEEDVS